MLYLEDKLSKIVKAVYLPSNFGEEIDNDEFYMDEDIYEGVKKILPNCYCDIYNGVSKAVAVIEGFDSVLKFPFNGYFKEDEYYDEEIDEWVIAEDMNFFEFERADAEDSEWDYCAKEAEIYLETIEDGFEDMFVETKFLANTENGHPVYIQEKITPFDTTWNMDKYKPSKGSREKAENMKARYGLPKDFIGNIIDCYGESYCKAFIDYLSDANITDLHNGNIGYRKDGRPCLFDYAGWRDRSY